MTLLFFSQLTTPLGDLGIFANENAVYRIEFIDRRIEDQALMNGEIYQESKLSLLAKTQLRQYFAGELMNFTFNLAPQGTPFRQLTWQALLTIPYGETRYYGQQAELMNNPKAVRAVGAANGANPIAIVIPCHRVIGKNGSLTGYAGGLDRKEWLLNFEQQQWQNKKNFVLS